MTLEEGVSFTPHNDDESCLGDGAPLGECCASLSLLIMHHGIGRLCHC